MSGDPLDATGKRTGTCPRCGGNSRSAPHMCNDCRLAPLRADLEKAVRVALARGAEDPWGLEDVETVLMDTRTLPGEVPS